MNTEMIRNIMWLNGLNQNETSAKIGMSRASLSYKLNGYRKFKSEELKKIADLFDVNINIFLIQSNTN